MSDPNCYCESYYSYVCLSCRARSVREAESRPEADESLRIAAALAECAPTVEDRYNWSAKDHAELPALVAALRERAEKAERERDEAKSIASNIAANWLTEAQAATSEHDVARTEATELRAEVERLREALGFYADPETWFAIFCETDVSVVEIDGARVKVPGKRAREALKGGAG